jgi:hypothetical protein
MVNVLLASLVLTLFFSAPALAQFADLLPGQEISVALEPAFAQPHTQVIARLNDYAAEVDGATIDWQINGVARNELRNQRSVTFMSGEAGSETRLVVRLTLPGGAVRTASAAVVPRYLDIIVEPQSYVPPFYRGRPLPSAGSTVNLTALIDGGAVSPAGLSYLWRVNNETLLGGATRGRNKVSFTMPLGGAIVSLEVRRASDGAILGRRVFELMSSEPVIVFYEVSPLYGLLELALQNFPLIGQSATVRAVPYYLDIETYNNPGLAEWRINGVRTTNNGDNPYEATLSRAFGVGIVSLDFHVRNLDQLLHGARGRLQVNF